MPAIAGAAIGGIPLICVVILGVELCERLAFYTFTGTQEFYLEKAGYTVAEAGGLNAAMSTLCMAWAVLAGWVADVSLGRYHTIVIFGLLYVMGGVMSTVAAWPAISSCRWYLAGVMGLVPLGTAGIKANISIFGADQYDATDPVQAEAQSKFFSWFYLSINLGSAVAYGYLTTMGTNGGLGVPRSYGYFAVYAIASGCMLCAVIGFMMGKSRYRIADVQPKSSMGVVAHHISNLALRGNGQAIAVCFGFLLLTLSILFSVVQATLPGSPLAGGFTGTAFVCSAAGILLVVLPCRDPTWLQPVDRDEANTAADAREFLKLLPVLFTANLAFSALYNSMQFWYQQQACQMDLRVPFSGSNSQFAGSFFMIADCLGIVIVTPIALTWLNPKLEKAFGGLFDHAGKYGLGMLFGVFSVLMAAYMEMARREKPLMTYASNCAPDGIKMSSISAAWMVVPFFLMGVGEIYTQPVLMHFAYTHCPESMRTLTAVTGLVVGAVSNALFTVQISALSRYVPNDLNRGHLEYGYFVCIATGMLFYAFFVRAMNSFKLQHRRL